MRPDPLPANPARSNSLPMSPQQPPSPSPNQGTPSILPVLEPRPALGSCLVLLSVFLFMLTNALVNYSTNYLSLPVILPTLSRATIQLLLSAMLLGFLRPASPCPAAVPALILRGLLGALSVFLRYSALSHLQLPVAIGLFSTAPLFAAAISYPLLGEPPTRLHAVALLLSLTGAGLLATSASAPAGGPLLLALLSAGVSASVVVAIRFVGGRAHFLHNVVSQSLALLATVPLVRAPPAPLAPAQAGALAAIGVAAFVAAACLNRGAQLLPAAHTALLRTAEIPLALAFQPHLAKPRVVGGAVLVAAASAAVIRARPSREERAVT